MSFTAYLATFADTGSIANKESSALSVLQYHLMTLTLNTITTKCETCHYMITSSKM